VNTLNLTAQPRIRVDNGAWVELGAPLAIPATWLNPNDSKGLALGLIATSGTSGVPFPATWDYFLADFVTIIPTPTPTFTPSNTSTPTHTETPMPTATTGATETETPATGTPDATATATATGTVESTATPTATTDAPSATPTATPTDDTAVNLLVNGDFEALKGSGKPELAPWVLKFGTGDKVKCNKDKDGDGIFEHVVAQAGNCAFVFKGGGANGAPENAKIEQNVNLNGVLFSAGDTLTFSGFANAGNPAVKAKVKVVVKYTDVATKDKITVTLVQTSGYQPISGSVVLTGSSVTKIKVMVGNTSPAGKVSLDTLSLTNTEGAGAAGNGRTIPLP
jgi:hypothetical protein